MDISNKFLKTNKEKSNILFYYVYVQLPAEEILVIRLLLDYVFTFLKFKIDFYSFWLVHGAFCTMYLDYIHGPTRDPPIYPAHSNLCPLFHP